jgi:hypothetical protein
LFLRNIFLSQDGAAKGRPFDVRRCLRARAIVKHRSGTRTNDLVDDGLAMNKVEVLGGAMMAPPSLP